MSLESELVDLDAVRRHFALDAAILLGHSFGAIIAMEYALLHPERVTHLILLNPAPASHADYIRFREHRHAREARTLEAMRAIVDTPRYRTGDVDADAEYYRLHFAKALRRPERVEDVVRRLRAHFAPADIVKARAIEARLYAQTWDRPDYSAIERLGRRAVPTLVIHGEHDIIPVECATSITDALAGSRRVVLPECGHFAYLERPAEVHAAIAAFVAA